MDYQVVKVKEDILVENSKRAAKVRKNLKEKGIFLLNVMASPGSGKTTLLTNVINRLKDKYKIGVMEADIDGEVDAERISRLTGVKAIQIQTGGTCHLTAQMTEDSLNAFGIDGLDLVILENIGNLVCPAEFDTGSNINMMLLSVPEGDDKPLKYPLMFEVSNIAVISKIDTLPAFPGFSYERVEKNIHMRNKNAKIFKVSALKDEGIEPLVEHLINLIEENIK